MDIKRQFPGYVHHGSWWAIEDNRAPVLEYIRRKQWVTLSTVTPIVTDGSHSKTEVFGVTLEVFMDLGGDFNLVQKSLFPEVVRRIQDGTDKVTRIVPLSELGCAPMCRPIDMAGGSSVVHVPLWAGRNHHCYHNGDG